MQLKLPAIQVPDRKADPLREMLSREADGDLRRALARLRPQYREALMLQAEQLPYREIAEKMGIPINTVGTYIIIIYRSTL